MSQIWFTSDTHFHHANIVRGTTSWEAFKEGSSHQQTRNFDTLEEHDERLIENINHLVKPNDILYHLGDWSFGGFQQIPIFRRRLECKNIHLIYGNHDQHIESNKNNYQDLFASVQYVKAIKHGGQRYFLSHYSHQVWNKSHHGVIHLFGHSHGSLKGIGKSMDVGVDTHNLFPYHISEVLHLMDKIPLIPVDHHNESTD